MSTGSFTSAGYDDGGALVRDADARAPDGDIPGAEAPDGDIPGAEVPDGDIPGAEAAWDDA